MNQNVIPPSKFPYSGYILRANLEIPIYSNTSHPRPSHVRSDEELAARTSRINPFHKWKYLVSHFFYTTHVNFNWIREKFHWYSENNGGRWKRLCSIQEGSLERVLLSIGIYLHSLGSSEAKSELLKGSLSRSWNY